MKSQRGFVLIGTAVTSLLLLAVIGLAFDLGRIYIARNEAQNYTDAAALTAASKLDGTTEGQKKARDAALKIPMRWNLGTQPFTGVQIEFGADGQTVRVTAPQNNVEIVFLRAVGGPDWFTVPAHSTAITKPVRLTE